MIGGNSIANNDVLRGKKTSKYDYKPNIDDYGPSPLLWMSLQPGVEMEDKMYGKEHDCGWRIPIMDRIDHRTQDDFQSINEFTTNISFKVPPKYCLEVTGTDDLLKAGYMMLQSKIINPGETEPLTVLLYKFSDTSDDLELPVDYLYVMPRRIDYLHLSRYTSNNQPVYEDKSYPPQRNGGRQPQQQTVSRNPPQSRRAAARNNNRTSSSFFN